MVSSYVGVASLRIAISWVAINFNNDANNAPDPLVWSAGGLPKRRRLVHAVRNRAFLPGRGPPGGLLFLLLLLMLMMLRPALLC